MSDSSTTDRELSAADREEIMSGLFAQMVMQQANMAMMLLGKSPHPESGKMPVDLEGARMFIDQLEMLEAKTKGNLSREEQALLKQSLMSLQLAFVEAVEPGDAKPNSPEAEPSTPVESAKSESEPSRLEKPTTEEESRKKFSKKY